jgi:peptidoglycan-associated lipoprotein
MRIGMLAVCATMVFLVACSSSSDTGGGGTGALAANDSSSTGKARPGTEQDLQQNVGDRVFFESDASGIDAERRQALERQARWLDLYPNVTITIEGHCDERGTREYNLGLGERRANAVKQTLVALGINPRRIKLISYGKERPAVVGSQEAAWAQNRRAVTVVD